MTHHYELKSFNDDGSMTTVLKIEAEPKNAKAEAKAYADQHPGLYTLYKIEKVKLYFTDKREVRSYFNKKNS